MATLNLNTLPLQYHRFAPLIAKLLTKPASSIIRIQTIDRSPQTCCSLLGQVFKAIIDFPTFKTEFSTVEIAQFRSKHSLRIRSGSVEVSEKGEAYNKIITYKFDYEQGQIVSEKFDETKTSIYSSFSSSANTVICEYTPERFLALCLLRNECVLDASPTLTNVQINQLPDHSMFTNIVVIESGPNNVSIL